MSPDLTEFQTALGTELSAYLASQTAALGTITANETILTILSHLSTLSQDGKRIRPFLIYALYKKNVTGGSLRDISSLLLATELLHLFCLVHDDVMDESHVRHGVPTIETFAHTQYYKSTPTTARNQAILTGDVLFNSVFKLLHSYTRDHPFGSEIQEIFHTLVDEVCVGQMLDIHLATESEVSHTAITEKNRLKTAYYSLARPLHLGTILANRRDLTEQAIAFGEELGLLYQIQDDMLDVLGDETKTKKPTFQDITQNQHTIMRSYIEREAPEYAIKLKTFLGRPVSEEDSSALRALFADSGALTFASTCIEHHAAKAKTIINSLPQEEDKELFSSIMELVYSRTH